VLDYASVYMQWRISALWRLGVRVDNSATGLDTARIRWYNVGVNISRGGARSRGVVFMCLVEIRTLTSEECK
jgi:hypothetical protein